ncbi:hypothetical protein L838_0091 [Mycobacterium avium MAV_120709_2344]|nr:hypothetical protein L838_0091 [Mycobacterium avium MAV_120709_2344]
MTRLTTAPPSVSGSTARCHPGPCSASGRLPACSVSQASTAFRGRGTATTSRAPCAPVDTQR